MLLPERRLVQRLNGISVFRRDLNLANYGPGYDELALITKNEFLWFDGIEANHCYINPEWTIVEFELAATKRFLQRAETALLNWKRRLQKLLTRQALDKVAKSMDYRNRQCAISGLLILNQEMAHIKRINWRTSR